MLLSTFERLLTLSVLPKEGDLTTIRIVRDLKSALSFTEAEHDVLKFTQDPTTRATHWVNQVDPIEIPVGPKALDVIVGGFEALNKAKKLTTEHLPVYERFLEIQATN